MKFLIEDINNLNIPDKLYHATQYTNYEQIKKDGFISNEHKKKLNYSDSERGVVYLATDPYEAESYAEITDMDEDDFPDGYFDDIIILEINTIKLNKDNFSIDTNIIREDDEEISSYIYKGSIPLSAVTVFEG